MRKDLSKHVAIVTSAALSALTRVVRWASRATLSLLGAIAVSGPLTMAQSQPGRILSTTTLDVFECNIDGSNCFTVAGHWQNATSRQPSVASNGTIAFSGNMSVDTTNDGNYHIFLMNPDGTNVRQITFTPASHSSGYSGEHWPTISPDGTMVAFLATLSKAPDGSQNNQIYVVNVDGSNLRQVTQYMANPSVNQPTGDYTGSVMIGLAWSPDSQKLAFRGSVYTSQCGGQATFVNAIGSIKPDGSSMQILACDKNDGYVSSIDWSPDGTLIAWGRNVSHGAQGCSGCVGEPAVAFLDLSGRNRYSAGITSSKLTTDACTDPYCVHFSPDSTRLAYFDAYPNNGNPCQGGPCYISLINLDGSGQTNTTVQYAGGLWWMPGAVIPVPAQLALAGSAPNVPPNPVEIWPGFSQELVPTLNDSSGSVIFHSAATYPVSGAYGHYQCLEGGPYGLAFYSSDYNTGTVSATSGALTSNSLSYKCWVSQPCTFSLGSASTGIPAGGGPNTVNVVADPGTSGSTCPWVAKTSASWITITSGVWGSGNSGVNFNVAANLGAERQGTITIAGRSHSVTQDAAAPGPPVIQAIADSWDYVSGLAPGEWVTIAGTNLATGPPRTWDLAGV